jgi:hypothetical protein
VAPVGPSCISRTGYDPPLQLDSHGITIALPTGWEGRISRRDLPTVAPATGATAGRAMLGALGAAGERPFPIAHLANFALPEDRGDFGSGAVELMGAGNLFVCLFEYGPESVGTALFAPQGMPRDLQPSQFNPRALQRIIPGQAGFQQFFTEGNRAFCLFVVLGALANAPTLVPSANSVLAATTFQPR